MALNNLWWQDQQGLQDSSEYPGNDYPSAPPPAQTPPAPNTPAAPQTGSPYPTPDWYDPNGPLIQWDPSRPQDKLNFDKQQGAGAGGFQPWMSTPPWGNGYPGVPQFNNAPEFSFGEKYTQPTEADAQNEPGYKFRLQQGLGAGQASAAAKGILNTGGTIKALQDYAQNYASQEYGNVVNRYNTGYNTRYGVARDTHDRNYARARDMYAPNLLEWQTNYAAQQHALDLQFQQWMHDNASMDTILNNS